MGRYKNALLTPGQLAALPLSETDKNMGIEIWLAFEGNLERICAGWRQQFEEKECLAISIEKEESIVFVTKEQAMKFFNLVEKEKHSPTLNADKAVWEDAVATLMSP